MRIGYPCINRSIGCTANSTFRLANYSEENLIEKVNNNLDCLEKILIFNAKNNLLFFRISSDLVPFASHPVCTFNWQDYFSKRFKEIGRFIKNNDMRISMHPDQFVLINSIKDDIFRKSVDELRWQCELLDLMKLDSSAKVQIHVGGVYGDKERSMARFEERYKTLPAMIKKRLAIENDERMYSVKDCIQISEETNIPVIFDSFHHQCLNNGESRKKGLMISSKTWKKKDGIPITDYSSQNPEGKKGKHTEHIDIKDFRKYLKDTEEIDFDIMLEIKDKEKSALEAVKIIAK